MDEINDFYYKSFRKIKQARSCIVAAFTLCRI